MNAYEIAAIAPSAANELRTAIGARSLPTTRSNRQQGSVATVWIEGVLTPWWLAEVRRDMLAILRDDNVQDVVIRMNTPGGLVQGTPETADLVRELSTAKRVVVVAEDFLCSGGYWIASQATTIVAAPSTVIGSIGVISVLVDASARFEAEGVRVIPVASSDAKSRGLPGVPVTEADIATVQRQVDELTRWFLRYIAATPPRRSGRRMKADQVLEALDAEVYYAADALKRGYIDEVLSVEKAMERVRQSVDPHSELRGFAAYEKFDALACEQFKVDFAGDLSKSQEESLRAKYPTLAERAADYKRLGM